MSVKVYNKLVRDNIPAIIASSGKSCSYSFLTIDKDFEMLLFQKIHEEYKELNEALIKENKQEIIEELADLLEVLNAFEKLPNYNDLCHKEMLKHWYKYIDLNIKAYEINKTELCAIQEKKRQEKGGFDKRVYLICVAE